MWLKGREGSSQGLNEILTGRGGRQPRLGEGAGKFKE